MHVKKEEAKEEKKPFRYPVIVIQPSFLNLPNVLGYMVDQDADQDGMVSIITENPMDRFRAPKDFLDTCLRAHEEGRACINVMDTTKYWVETLMTGLGDRVNNFGAEKSVHKSKQATKRKPYDRPVKAAPVPKAKCAPKKKKRT